MKLLVLLAFLTAAAYVSADIHIDWDTVKPIWQISAFQQRYPKLFRMYQKVQDRRSSQGSKPFVVGGEMADQNQFPYMAALIIHLENNNGFCGGSIISSRYILTVAHCIKNIPSAVVITNAWNLTNPLEQGQTRQFTDNLFPHPDFTDDIQALNDIGLVKLQTALQFTSTFRPIRLPSIRQIGSNFANFLGTVSGWGTINDNSNTLANVVHFVRNPIITNLNCRLSWPLTGIHESQICMSGDNGRGPCNGDSGSPLTVTEADFITTQVGIVSWGSAFGCSNNQPSVYTRLTVFLRWIQNNTDVILN